MSYASLLYYTDAQATMHGIYYVDMINQQFGDYFAKQMNLQETLYTNIMYLRLLLMQEEFVMHIFKIQFI